MRLNLVNTGVRYNATDVRLDSGKALDKTLSPGKLDGLPAVLEGRGSGDVGEGNLLQCNFSQPRREKKTKQAHFWA